MTLLILVKHAMPEIVTNVPARDWQLSEEGRQRCVNLAELLRGYAPDIIFASKEPKGSETGQIVAQILAIPFQEADNLHEHERHNEQYSGTATFHTNIRGFFMQPDKRVYGIETANEAFERFSAATAAILDQHQGKTVVIVSHGTVITLYVSHHTGLEPFTLWTSLGLPSFVVLDTENSTVVGSVHDIP